MENPHCFSSIEPVPTTATCSAYRHTAALYSAQQVLRPCPAGSAVFHKHLSPSVRGKPVVVSWLADVCQRWPTPPHSQLCELCVRHSCRALLAPMRQMIPHYHTRHRIGFSTPLLAFLLKQGYHLFSLQGHVLLYCGEKEKWHLESVKCSSECKTQFLYILDSSHPRQQRTVCVLECQVLPFSPVGSWGIVFECYHANTHKAVKRLVVPTV